MPSGECGIEDKKIKLRELGEILYGYINQTDRFKPF